VIEQWEVGDPDEYKDDAEGGAGEATNSLLIRLLPTGGVGGQHVS
jgi:hypothetical protein